MPPKYSSCFTDLVEFLNIEINFDSMSDVSSMMSQTFSLRKEGANGMSIAKGTGEGGKNDESSILKSRNILQSKKNLLI